MQGNAKLLPRDYVGVTPPSDPGAAPDAKRGLSESSAERPARRLFKTSGRTNRYIPWVHISAVLFAIDVVAALAAGLLARAQIAGIFAVPHLSTSLVTTVAPLACCRVFYVRGLYTPSKLVRPGRFSAIAFASVEVGAILIATASIGMLLSPGESTVWLGGGSAYAMAVPPSILVGIVCSVVLMATRWSCCLIWQFLSRLNFSCNRVLLAGEPAERVIAQLAATDCASMEVTGVLSDSPHDGSHIGLKKYRVLGKLDDLAKIVRQEMVDTLVVVLPWSAQSDIAHLLARAFQLPVDVHFLPDETSGLFLAGSEKAETPIQNSLVVRRAPLSGSKAMLKRVEDIMLASALLLAFAPLMTILAAVIKLDSPGPVLFWQQRRGFNGRVFEVIKFRSMYVSMSDPAAHCQTSPSDRRVTRVGALLRRHSLDELPQLLNVLRGDMSIVGPRPHPLGMRTEGTLVDAVQAYEGRCQMRPGLTGWAQVNGWRGELNTLEKLERRIEHDLFYIGNWSLLLDLQILLRTFLCVLHDKNAH